MKLAAVSAVAKYVKDGTVIKDVDALDLLEWATLDLTEEDDYLETLGPMRVRAVKASPKDMNAASRCLESCLIHWDLASAQQVWLMLHVYLEDSYADSTCRSQPCSTGHSLRRGTFCFGILS